MTNSMDKLACQRLCEELDAGRLITIDPLDVCIERCDVAGSCELLLCEICQGLAVGGVLEMLVC
jgi:hypothetical protein